MESQRRFSEDGGVFSSSQLDLDPTRRGALAARNLKIAARPRKANRRRLRGGGLRGETDRFDPFLGRLSGKPARLASKVPATEPKSRLLASFNNETMPDVFRLSLRHAILERVYGSTKEQVLFLRRSPAKTRRLARKSSPQEPFTSGFNSIDPRVPVCE